MRSWNHARRGSSRGRARQRERRGKKEKEAWPGWREVSERSQMFDTRTVCVLRFTLTGIMLDYAWAAVLFGGSHTGKAEQTVSCSVAALQFGPDLYRGFMISSTRVYFF